MPWPGESKVEQKLGKNTLGVFALLQREDGSCSLVGMRGITDGAFVSSKKLVGQYDEHVLSTGVKEVEVSSLAALGGELFVINHVDLSESAEELRALLKKIAGEEEKRENEIQMKNENDSNA